MKRRFTIVAATLALLAIFIAPMGMMGQTYEQLTSIANIDESAQYVLGIDGTGFHYEGTSSWGKTALPTVQTPIYYTLTKANDGNSFTAQAIIGGTTYYLQVPTSNTFSMSTSSSAQNISLIIGTTQVSGTNYAVANKNTTTRHLRINGTSGLRSYAGTTGTMAFFYKVVTSSGPVQLDAPTLTATSGNEKITLTWNAVAGASSYTIQYADNSSFTGATTITDATSPKEITGLTNGTTYYFKAMSVGDDTDYISSDYGTAVTATPANIVTITITQDDIDGFTNSYNWYEWADGGVSGQVYAYKSGGMQFNSSKTAYWIYNSEAVPGNITSVRMTKASGTDRSWTLKAGTSALEEPTDGTQIGSAQTVGTSGATWNVSGSYNYFLLYVSGGSTVINSIEITYIPTSSTDPSIVASPVELGYNAIGGSISYTINNEPDPAGTISAEVTAGDWLTLGQNLTFTCSQNDGIAARTATVALTYTYGDNQTVSADVTVTQNSDPDLGTLTHPYTVAQARAIIEPLANNTPTSASYYATGIVKEIVTAWGNQGYENITFNMVDNQGDEVFLQAYRCISSNTADASEVQVNDVVVVYGQLKKYNSTYEFAQNCQLITLTHPTVAVEAPTFSPAAGVYAETQIVTISCETEGATIYYTTDGTEPTSESNEFDQDLSINGTTTIKAIAIKGSDASTVATATYHIANSASNPYSVPEAQAFHEYPTPEIFVHGIVSTAPAQAPTSEGELTYYISYDGTTTDQLEVYHGKGLDEAAFTAQDDIQVGDIVTIFGTVQVYNDIIEFASGNYLVDFERPGSTEPSVTVSPNTIDAPAAGATGTLALAYENITEFYSFDYIFCDAEGEELQEDPDWIYAEIQNDEVLDYTIYANDGDARTTYIKVYTYDDAEEEVYAIVTINQAQYVADYATLPFAYDGNGTGDLPNGFTVSGLGTYPSSPAMKFDGTGDYAILKINERPGTLTFDIKGNTFSGGTFTVQTSVDGTTYTDLETYTELGAVQSEEFTNLGENVRYIKWIYTEKSSGNVALGNITLAAYAAIPTITVNPATVNVDAISEEEDYFEGTLDLTWENLEISDFFEDFAIQYYDAEGEEVSEPDWIMADLATQDPSVGEGYLVSYVIEENESAEARTAYFKVLALGDEDYVYSNLVTITQAAYVAPPTPGNWVLTSIDDLTEDDVFVIVGTDIDDDVYALPHDGGTTTAPAATTVTIVEGTISGEPAEELQWNLGGNATDGYIFYPNGSSDQWLYCTATNNGVRVGTNENKAFSIDEDGYMVNNATSRVLSVYVNGGIPQDWRCYSNYSNNPVVISFYKKVETVVTETYTTEMLTGYGNGDGHYYLIASPVYVDPENTNMLTADENGNHTYDLYYFDQGEDDEWRNYRQEAFDLVPGQGYLYANKNDIQLTFTGVPYDGDGEIELVTDEGALFEGWNLVGNPFGEAAVISDNYFEMNEDGDEIVAGESEVIEPMKGVFVRFADTEVEGVVTFEPAATGSMIDDYKKVVLNLTRNRGNVIDRAIVRFGEGRQLPKFQLNENSTKVYFSQGNQDYAVVRSGNEGEMPVNFKAETRGSYTFTVEAKNVEMNYLHLFDTKTGNDIDLLQTPSYTFEANVGDNVNRFRLMFDANAIEEHNAEASFAYFNGSEWVISNMGDATLQVVDVMGRVLSSETINGNAELSISEVPGVYMFRLVNGNNVKVQKVIVK